MSDKKIDHRRQGSGHQAPAQTVTWNQGGSSITRSQDPHNQRPVHPQHIEQQRRHGSF